MPAARASLWLPAGALLLVAGALLFLVRGVVPEAASGAWKADWEPAEARRLTESFGEAGRRAADARLAEEQAAELRRVEGEVSAATLAGFAPPAGWVQARRREAEARARGRAAALDLLHENDRRTILDAMLETERQQRSLAAAEISRAAAQGLWWSGLGALLLVAGGLLAAFSRRVGRPLSRLERGLEDVAAGSGRRLDPEAAGALSGTVRAFNQMADTLDGVRRDLTRQVDRKTAALAAALTEQRELQDRLIRQEKMAALGTLAGGVAHEFNNLMGGIRGCVDEQLEDAADEEARENLLVIRRAADRGRAIVDGLLRFSQAAHRSPEILDLAAAAREAVALASRQALHREVTVQAIGDEPCPVLGDPTEIHQVILNLVQNAVQSSPAGTGVEVETRCSRERVTLEVRDRGSGVPDAIADRVFEPFFTTREREGGTGLGLAISHGIVQALGGELGFRRRVGGGTTFALVLPSVSGEGQD